MFDITINDIKKYLQLYSKSDYDYIKYSEILDIHQFETNPTDDFIIIELGYLIFNNDYRVHACFINKNNYEMFIRNKKINKLKYEL